MVEVVEVHGHTEAGLVEEAPYLLVLGLFAFAGLPAAEDQEEVDHIAAALGVAFLQTMVAQGVGYILGLALVVLAFHQVEVRQMEALALREQEGRAWADPASAEEAWEAVDQTEGLSLRVQGQRA